MSIEQSIEFSYDGYLVFNGIYATEILNPEFEFDQVIDEELTDFSPGSHNEPGRGYTTLPITQHLTRSHEVSGSLQDFIGETRAFRYQEEEWEYQEVELDNGTDERPVKSTISLDAYWAFPDYLFLKGNKTKADYASDLIQLKLDDYLEISEINFNPDFLLWLLSKEKSGETLPGQISTSMLTDAEIEGEERDRFGRRSKVDDSTDITKSTTVLLGVLQQKDLTAIEGVFEVAGKFVKARVSTDGRVHVKADHAVKGSPDIERMALALAFLKGFTRLYEEWLDLRNEEKYPPIEFFEDIYEECDRQGVEVTFSIDDVIASYRQKGSSDEYQQRQSGLGEYA